MRKSVHLLGKLMSTLRPRLASACHCLGQWRLHLILWVEAFLSGTAPAVKVMAKTELMKGICIGQMGNIPVK